MKVICWNVRGVGSQGSPYRIKNLVRQFKPQILCLIEPMKDTSQIRSVGMSLGWDSSRCVGNEKIWVYWSGDVAVRSVEQNEQIITVKAENAEIEGEFWMSFVYASCNPRKRRELWEEIGELNQAIENQAWAILGDFNCILKAEEKKGGLPYNMAKSREFQQCVDDVGLREVVYYGGTYTWWNGRHGEQSVWKRLDRCLVNEEWETKMKTYTQYLSKAASDHAPMVINVDPPIKIGKKPFMFLNIWTEHEQFLNVVRGVWEEEVQGNAMFRFKTKLKKAKAVLKDWNWAVFGNVFERVKNVRKGRERWRSWCRTFQLRRIY